MHFHHIFPGQDKAVPSFGEAVEWKPPDKIYTIDNTINTILRYVLGFFFLIFPPSTVLSLLFNRSSFLIIFFSSFFHIFSIFSQIFLIIIKLKNAIHILIQLVQCGYIKPLKSMQLIRQFNNAIQLVAQLSLKSLQIQVSHQSLTVTQLIQCTWYIKPLKLIELTLQ